MNVLILSLVTVLTVALVVAVHYEVLGHLSQRVAEHLRPRFRSVVMILGGLIAHIGEIWVFAFAYYLLCETLGGSEQPYGRIEGAQNGLLDYVYFSATTFTTLGFGDLVPQGHVRFLTAMESLCGLCLVAWTATFTYLEMHPRLRYRAPSE